MTTQAMPSSQATFAPGTSPQTDPNKKTILLVDDDSSIRAVFSTTLEHHGLTVLQARHADEALEVCHHYRGDIHLLLADLMLPPKIRLAQAKRGQPPVHGIDLMQKVCSLKPGIRVILFSGQPDQTIKRLGVIPTGTPFLRKPFSLDALVRAVFDVLELPLNSQ
jgi:CheY-like chemotaxis protein